jgi:ribosomal protein S18 acetylase RimI-like enzyme
LDQAFAWAKESKDKVDEIYLHVQISNDVAVAFYERMGFSKGERIDDYYKRITPPHAFVLSKKL